MNRLNGELDASGIRAVLDGMQFPAQRWQVVAQAHYYGAPCACSARLAGLPVRTYRDANDVAAELRKLVGDQRAAPPPVTPGATDVPRVLPLRTRNAPGHGHAGGSRGHAGGRRSA
jgi:hypothetical protein